MKRILVAEDDDLVQDSMKRLLGSPRTDLTFAFDGREALQFLRTGSYDLLISDVDMIGMDGVALFRHVREEFPTLRFVFFTGSLDSLRRRVNPLSVPVFDKLEMRQLRSFVRELTV